MFQNKFYSNSETSSLKMNGMLTQVEKIKEYLNTQKMDYTVMIKDKNKEMNAY